MRLCYATHLDAILGKIRLEREHFASVHVRVVSFLKGLFQLVQLVTGEYRAAAGGEGDRFQLDSSGNFSCGEFERRRLTCAAASSSSSSCPLRIR